MMMVMKVRVKMMIVMIEEVSRWFLSWSVFFGCALICLLAQKRAKKERELRRLS